MQKKVREKFRESHNHNKSKKRVAFGSHSSSQTPKGRGNKLVSGIRGIRKVIVNVLTLALEIITPLRGNFLGSPHGTNTTDVVCKTGKRKFQGVPQSQALSPSQTPRKRKQISIRRKRNTKGDCESVHPGT